MLRDALKKLAAQQDILSEYIQSAYPQFQVPTELSQVEETSNPMAVALQFLLPMGLIAGGAYLGYKNIPKFIGKMQDLVGKGFTQKDMLNLVGRYNRDIGHYVERGLRNWGGGIV